MIYVVVSRFICAAHLMMRHAYLIGVFGEREETHKAWRTQANIFWDTCQNGLWSNVTLTSGSLEIKQGKKIPQSS